MPWTNQTKNASSFTNQSKGGSLLFGELPLDHPILAGLDFGDAVPGTGGKTLGELAFDSIINVTGWTNLPKS